MQYGFHVDVDRCSGCKACAMACKDKNNVPVGMKLRKVIDYGGGTWEEVDGACVQTNVFTYSVSLSCNHCADPACVKVCPTQAMTKDPETGIVSNRHDICIGCGSCRMACPYDAPRINPDLGYTYKCNMCADLVAEGKNPACVDACIMRCLHFGEIGELRSTYGDNADIEPLASSEITGPSLVVTKSRFCEWNEAGAIRNSAEELE